MKTPKPGELVTLTKPVPLPQPSGHVMATPNTVLTSEDTLIFMGVQEGKWRVMAHGTLEHSWGPRAFQHAQFLIPTEYFEQEG